jgi:hypothetical protein
LKLRRPYALRRTASVIGITRGVDLTFTIGCRNSVTRRDLSPPWNST